MSIRPIKITANPIGLGTVHLADLDISDAVRAIDVHVAAGDIPAVTVELRIDEVERIDLEEAEVLIPEAVKDTLVALGWTPPQGDTP